MSALGLLAGCASIVGLEDEYSVAGPGGSGVGNAGGTTHTGTGAGGAMGGGTPTGTGGTSTGSGGAGGSGGDGGSQPTIVTAGLIEDLDADRGVGINGTTVQSWANQAVGGDDVVADHGAVTRVTDGLNGYDVLSFEHGSRMVGDDPTPFAPLINGTGHTWFAVVEPRAQDSVDKNQIFGTLLDQHPWSGFTGGVNTSNALPYTMVRPGSDDLFVQSSAITVDSWVILAGRLRAGTGNQLAEIFVGEGTAAGARLAPITGLTSSGPLTLGAERLGGSEHFDGDVARLLIYNRSLDDSELRTTGAALSWLYGVNGNF